MKDVGTGSRWAREAVLAVAVAGVVAGLWWAWPRLFPDPLAQAKAAYDHHDWRGAATLARQFLKEWPGDPDALRLLARSSVRLGHDDSAQAIYGRLGHDAMRAEDFFLLASGLVRQGRIEPAIAVL